MWTRLAAWWRRVRPWWCGPKDGRIAQLEERLKSHRQRARTDIRKLAAQANELERRLADDGRRSAAREAELGGEIDVMRQRAERLAGHLAETRTELAKERDGRAADRRDWAIERRELESQVKLLEREREQLLGWLKKMQEADAAETATRSMEIAAAEYGRARMRRRAEPQEQ